MTREQQMQDMMTAAFWRDIEEGNQPDNGDAIEIAKTYERAYQQGWRAADQHPQWIPVEERLPEERKVVWVRKHFNKEVLGEFDIYDSAAFCNGEFQCDNSCNVTHWMPIVPPRKEE